MNASRPGSGAVVAWWRSVSDALTPVLGSRGVAALYQRSVHLAATQHHFLAGLDTASTELDLTALQALLDRQPEPAIAAAATTLAATLVSLLEGLVGPTLTQRLLAHPQAQSTDGSPAQDISQ